MYPLENEDGTFRATHHWDGSMYCAYESSGMPDLFPPSKEHGISYFSDLSGQHYDVISHKLGPFAPSYNASFTLIPID